MRLLKTIVVVTLVAGLLIGGALPVLADTGVATNQSTPSFLPEWGKGHWGWGKVRAIRGEVTSVGTNEIKVDGKTIMVDENTQIRVPTLGKERSLSDIQVGMQIVALVYEPK